MALDDKTIVPTQTQAGTTNQLNLIPVRSSNPLSQYASYTYQLSLYAITPEAYNLYQINNKQFLPKDQGVALIVQSGGINNTSSNRAAGFEFDYYIDDVRLKAVVAPDAQQTSTVTYDIEFKIYEQLGFKFVTNLNTALETLKSTSQILKNSTLNNSSRMMFVLGIKFLGYDIQGNLIQDVGNQLFREKLYDMVLTSIKFKLDGNITVYNCKGVVTRSTVMGPKNGIINNGAYNLTGKTVGEILESLMAKLTEDQKNAAQSAGRQSGLFNTYTVEFAGPGSEKIKNALMASPNDTDKSKNSATPPGATSTAQINPNVELKSFPNPLQKEIKFNSGTTITKAIEDVVKLSTYVSEPLSAVVKNETEPNPQTNTPNQTKQSKNIPFQWINVTPQIKKIENFNNLQSDFAYNINYIIQPYLTPEMTTAYVEKTASYYGPVKIYEYYYTGKNSEIIKFEQEFDNTLFTVALDVNGITSKTTGGGANIPVVFSGGATGGSNQGVSDPKNLVAQNSAVTYLMDPSKIAMAKIEILGDPDWLGQESVAYGKYNLDGFTVNFASQQVFLEIGFKEPVDYDHNVGTLTINNNIIFWQYPEDVRKLLQGRISYRVITVTSTFKSGKFTQVLDLIINTFPNAQSTAINTTTDTPTSTAGFKQDPKVNPRGSSTTSSRSQPNVVPNPRDDANVGGNLGLISDIIAP